MRRMNLTATGAGRELGVKRATLSRYLRGLTTLPQRVCHDAAVIEAARSGQPFETPKIGYSARKPSPESA